MSTISSASLVRQLSGAAIVLGVIGSFARADDVSPKPDERQLPTAMHSEMSEHPTVTVGRVGADVIGADNRALQAAVDYIAGLGGGVVEIGEGEYLMRDSLHLRSNVTVRGRKGKTILRKADAAVSRLSLDGDFGEQQVTVADASGFAPGAGVAIWDDMAQGFHTTVARITGRRGNTFSIDVPLRAEGIVVEGNKVGNPPLNGCRGGGIYLNLAFGTAIQDCVVRAYHGDGISFQQSNDVSVVDCTSEDNTDLGFHPGSGSQRPVMRNNLAHRNGTDGLFLCWRVRHGVFENNRIESNGRFGISIGHKDSDNVLRGNHIARNGANGVFFRDETSGMSPHRNRLEKNVIEDNGRESGTAGIRIRGVPSGLVFENNVIRDTRSGSQQTQSIGILVEDRVGPVQIGSNQIAAGTAVDDRRQRDAHLPPEGP
jgi:parallel beta-helix repeat protein